MGATYNLQEMYSKNDTIVQHSSKYFHTIDDQLAFLSARRSFPLRDGCTAKVVKITTKVCFGIGGKEVPSKTTDIIT